MLGLALPSRRRRRRWRGSSIPRRRGSRPLAAPAATHVQGLTLVHFSAQLEPCLTQENTLHTLNTPQHPLNTGYTAPARTPYPMQSAQVEPESGRV